MLLSLSMWIEIYLGFIFHPKYILLAVVGEILID